MSNRQGVWSLAAQYQAIADTNWTMAPGAPTGVAGTAGNAQVSVAFTAPTFAGIPATITEFKVTSSEGETATGTSSPIVVTSLTNGTAHTFTVQAQNAIGLGKASDASSSVTPIAPQVALYLTSNTNLDQFDMTASGNATDFGTISLGEGTSRGSVSSATRYVLSAYEDGNTLTYVTIASAGNGTDFGDASQQATGPAGLNSSTRGIFCGGIASSTRQNFMDYITIASTGNGQDFGNLTSGSQRAAGACSPTRGVVGGGFRVASSGASNVMDYVTIASTGNATDFGDLTQVCNNGLAGFSSNTRGIFGSLHNNSTPSNVINYITIASAGNGQDFGDLAVSVYSTTGFSNKISGFFAGGVGAGGGTNEIQKITIATTGNATDFANSTNSSSGVGAGNSGSHGGIAA